MKKAAKTISKEPIKYATIDENGNPTGFFDDIIHKIIPAGAIEISDKDWRAHVNNDHRRYNGSQWEPYKRVPPIDQLRAAATERIDRAAGRARQRYITDVPGQDGIYAIKSSQAREFASAEYNGIVPAMVLAEAVASDSSPENAAKSIIAQADAWIAIAATIERNRRVGKIAIEAAADQLIIDAARDAAITALNLI